jgi:hypothetical protein
VQPPKLCSLLTFPVIHGLVFILHLRASQPTLIEGITLGTYVRLCADDADVGQADLRSEVEDAHDASIGLGAADRTNGEDIIALLELTLRHGDACHVGIAEAWGVSRRNKC